MSLWNGAFLSQTGHIHVAFFSFIMRNVVTSKHCKCVHELARQGNVILILPSCNKQMYRLCLSHVTIGNSNKNLIIIMTFFCYTVRWAMSFLTLSYISLISLFVTVVLHSKHVKSCDKSDLNVM